MRMTGFGRYKLSCSAGGRGNASGVRGIATADRRAGRDAVSRRDCSVRRS